MSVPPISQNYMSETLEVHAIYDYNVQVEYPSCLPTLILYFILYFNFLLCFPELHTISVATQLCSSVVHLPTPKPPHPGSFFLVLREEIKEKNI